MAFVVLTDVLDSKAFRCTVGVRYSGKCISEASRIIVMRELQYSPQCSDNSVHEYIYRISRWHTKKDAFHYEKHLLVYLKDLRQLGLNTANLKWLRSQAAFFLKTEGVQGHEAHQV